MKILAQGDVPDDLVQAWTQHLRDFDVAHPGCHFEVIMQTDVIIPVGKMIEMLKVDPGLDIREVYEFTKRASNA